MANLQFRIALDNNGKDHMSTKPKLVFFQFRYDANVPEFLLLHKREHIKCLSEFFDVTVIREDCDYQQICEKHKPDLTLFESGLQLSTSHRLNIRNTDTCPDIPKLGFHNADAWSETRAGILSDMEHWGIETFFSICTTAAEHTPEIARNLFSWPNFIDNEVYRDYGESKIIPVLLTGCQDPQYPWRHKVNKIVSEFYPSMVCPHRGYRSRSGAGQVMYGERYARTINASWFVPTCGTVAKEVLRKHFEIPGCKACLLTEESPALKAAGFVDMKNCVFVDEHTVIDKIAYLFEHSDELGKITEAGYQLVHSRHTIKHRDQILQWFNLNKKLTANQKIVQLNPFGPLTSIEKVSKTENSHIISNGVHLALFQQADELLRLGKYEEAERLYLKGSNYIGGLMAEPRLRMALCKLYRGDPRTALSLIVVPIQRTLVKYKAIDPDPIEWAYFIICLICLGKLHNAAKRAGQFPWLRHPELDRTRAVISILTNEAITNNLVHDDELINRRSIHQLPSRTFHEWIEQLCIMLINSGQSVLAQTLKNYRDTGSLSVQQGLNKSAVHDEIFTQQRTGGKKTSLQKPTILIGKKVPFGRFDNPLLYSRVRLKLEKFILNLLHRIEAKYGYFLPYHLSAQKNDEFYAATQKLAREESIKTALVVGSNVGEGGSAAFLTGALENNNNPSIFCISSSINRFITLKKAHTNGKIVKYYDLLPYSSEKYLEEFKKTIKKIKEDNHITSFDAVLIDCFNKKQQLNVSSELTRELHGAKFVLLDDLNSLLNHENHNRLLRDPNFILVARNPGLRKGYAIFKKASDRE